MLVYSPFTVSLAGSQVLGVVVRFLKLDGIAVLGAFVGALLAMPIDSVLRRRGARLSSRALILGLLSFVLFTPLAVIEAVVFRAPPVYWLVLALPAAAFGFFGTLLYAVTEDKRRLARILAGVGVVVVLTGIPLWVLLPAV